MKGIVIKTTGDVIITDFGEPLYKTVGTAVGGFIEHVRPEKLPAPYCLICNEDGIMYELGFNLIASILYGFEKHGNPILGDVVIMKDGFNIDGEPDIVGLDENDIEKLNTKIERIEKIWKRI